MVYKTIALPTELLRRALIVSEMVCLFWTRPSRRLRQVGEVEQPKDRGDRTTLAVILALREMSLAVLVPFGENTRYDVVIDDGVTLAKVQIKTGRLRNGAVKWSLCSNYSHHASPRAAQRDYQGEVDYFGVFCPETRGVYLIPIGDLPMRRQGTLRVEHSKNNQQKFIRNARAYEIGRVSCTRPISEST